MFLIMLYTSASKLLRSSFCGGHFRDLNPKLLLFVLSSSSLLSLLRRSLLCLLSFSSKKKAFHPRDKDQRPIDNKEGGSAAEWLGPVP